MSKRYLLSALSAAIIILTSLSSALAGEIPRMGWNERTYEAVTEWLDRLEAYPPERLLVVVDCDNTVWADDIEDAMLKTALAHGYTSEEKAYTLFADTLPRKAGEKAIDRAKPLYDLDFLISYDRLSMAFDGLTLNQVQEIFEQAKKDGRLPAGYDEVRAVLAELMDRGVAVGFVSASIFFNVPPMLAEAGYDVPLWQMEGLDIFVQDPRDRDGSVLLSNLVQSKGVKTWKELLRRYGHLKLRARLSGVANTREGKSAGTLSVAARHVQEHNRRFPGNKISMSDLKLAGVFGDNFAPHSDIKGADPHLGGNDQGMARSLPFIDGALVLNIYRAVGLEDGKLDLKSKRRRNENFLALARQLRRLNTKATFANQIGIYKGAGRGTFSPKPIPRSQRP